MKTKYFTLSLLFIALSLTGKHANAQMVFMVDDSLRIPSIFLDEVVIRAPKQSMTLRELPASASVVSSRSISQAGIQSIKDVTAYTPNFFMPDYGSKLTSPIYIRGIGSRINEPSVGLYVDNVPYFDKASFDFVLFDIDRIEVLRGPQGTLYGRNTMGGIINIITRSPLDYQGTKVMLSAGNYGNYQGGLSHFLKLSDNFGYSVSLNYQQRDGFFTNAFDDSKVDELVNFGLRNRLVWRINERLTAENILSFEYSRQGGYAYALVDSNNVVGDVNYNHPSAYNRDLVSNGLVFKYAADKFDVIATTSYQYIDDLQDVDQDFTPIPIFVASQTQLQNMVSQEIIFKSKPNRRYEWVSGLFGFYQEFDRSVRVDVPANKMIQMIDFIENKQGLAFFHQSTMHGFLLERLSVGFGLRFDLEQDKLDYTNTVNMAGNPRVMADTLFPALNFSQFSPKVTLKYELSNFTNLYALVSRGYKTGGFNANLIRPEDIEEHLQFDAEHSWNYELGVKTGLFENKLQAELAVFYIDWKNQQIYQPVPTGQGSMLKNAGESVSKGFELSARASLPHNFDAVVAYGLTDAKFTNHVVDDNRDYSGNYIPYVPKHTLNLQLNKGFDLQDSRFAERINLTALYRAVGKHYWNEQNTQFEDGYGLLDLRGGIVFGKVQLDIWAKNVLGAEYTTFYFEIPQLRNRYAQLGKPFHFGVNLTVSL